MAPETTILILNRLAERHIAMIHGVVPGANVITAEPADAEKYIADTDILVGWGWMNIEPLLAKAERLKWVHALSAGVENLLTPTLVNSDIALTNSRGIHGIPVSEHVFSLILAFSRSLNVLLRQQQAKQWQRAHVDEIFEKTLGIIGLGSIGREIAKRGKGMGMNVLATKRELSDELFVDELFPADQLFDMLPACDYVVSALPLTEKTRGMLNQKVFAAMKQSAYFINISRGAVVNEADLIAALQAGIIKGAGLDVFAHEPLAPENPLWDMPNVIITPHLAALSPYYLDRAIKLFADDLTRFAQGREMFNIIDKSKGY